MYRYVSGNSSVASTCSFKPKKIGAKFSKYFKIQKGNEAALKRVVGTIGPVATAIGRIFH